MRHPPSPPNLDSGRGCRAGPGWWPRRAGAPPVAAACPWDGARARAGSRRRRAERPCRSRVGARGARSVDLMRSCKKGSGATPRRWGVAPYERRREGTPGVERRVPGRAESRSASEHPDGGGGGAPNRPDQRPAALTRPVDGTMPQTHELTVNVQCWNLHTLDSRRLIFGGVMHTEAPGGTFRSWSKSGLLRRKKRWLDVE